ncbi:MAG: hypothetical protein H6573_36125 [Lewinellaceae bacterium]|nr:hypothetical protein [Lewinellaceae bacterium]
MQKSDRDKPLPYEVRRPGMAKLATGTLSSKGWYHKANSPQAHEAMNMEWFAKVGLYDLHANYCLTLKGTAQYAKRTPDCSLIPLITTCYFILAFKMLIVMFLY